MAAQRRPMGVEAEVPKAVYTLDLQRVSHLLHIREDELLAGLQSNPSRSEIHGVVVESGEGVSFETVGEGVVRSMHSPAVTLDVEDDTRRSRCGATATHPVRTPVSRQILLVAAVRPTSLDEHGIPKCLIQLGSQTIISHIITQLYAAGVERVIISVAAAGHKIMAAVKQTPFYTKMQIEFLDLGRDNDDGHARSILAARQCFRGSDPFMIHTADHIFDKSVVSKLASYSLEDAAACVLVETDVTELTGLPPTVVKVQLDEDQQDISRIARNLEPYDGIDAGLFLSSPAIFDALEKLAVEKPYFSLAEALDSFITSSPGKRVTYLPTAGETWFSIETEEQLAYTQDTDGTSVLSPWTVFLASTPAGDPKFTKNMVIGVSAPDPDSSLRVADSTNESPHFDGFVVGVSNADHTDFRGSSCSTFSRSSYIDRNGVAHCAIDQSPFVLSFPLDNDMSTHMDESDAHEAYLIQMTLGDASGVLPPDTSDSEYLLAVSDQHEKGLDGDQGVGTTGSSSSSRMPLHLASMMPSDITQISLEARGHDENLEVTVVVQHQAPIAGYVLLVLALYGMSSMGVGMDELDNVSPPLLRLFWRNMATFMVTLPLVLALIVSDGCQISDPKWRELVGPMIVTSVTYVVYGGGYVAALFMTSLSHATLLNNTHSILLVVIKLAHGQPVALFEALGAAIGILGGGVTTMDTTASGGSDVRAASISGDLVALTGATGGAVYFMLVKQLRPRMHIIVFLCALTFTETIGLLLLLMGTGQDVEFSMDPHRGLFGWMTPSADRLPVIAYLVFVGDFMGTMGYAAVMKYFDPIVVSVACQLEPIVATAQGIVMGVDVIPGALTFIGAGLVIGGTCLVLYSQRCKTEEVDATEAVTASNAMPHTIDNAHAKKPSPTTQYGSMV